MLKKEKIKESINTFKKYTGISEETAKELCELLSDPKAPVKEISIKKTPKGANEEEETLYSTNNKQQIKNPYYGKYYKGDY